jgi:diguanylate cyclase (GGDEF)-like protein
MISLLTTGVGLLFAALLLITGEVVIFHQALVKDLTVQAKMIGSNCTAALSFQDQKDAEETLLTLRAAPHIMNAVVYTKGGDIFARYQRDTAKGNYQTPLPEKDGYSFGFNHLSLFHSIIVNDKYIGKLYLESDLKELYVRLIWFACSALIVVVIAFSGAFLLLSKLQQSITMPIFDLVNVMKTISKDKDYTMRAEIYSEDEMGSLARGFNEMLEHIQNRDMELDQHRKHLETLVLSRTTDLESTNKQLQEELIERKRVEEQMIHMAFHDNLTDLPNRYLLKDRLNQALASARQHKRLMAVLFLDLDNFKRVNDTLGHSAGDQLLRKVAGLLTKLFRKSDTIARPSIDELETTVSRLGGDEFTILITEFRDIQDTSKIAKRIIDLFQDPFIIGHQEVFITTSIGISLYPNDGDDSDILLKNADTAMYHAKEKGRNQFQYYSESMNIAALERFNLERDLRKALERRELLLHYQPQIDMRSGIVVGAEALVRWMHPDRGLIAPMEFIPLAEEIGLIVPIGEWIMHSACKQIRVCQENGFPSMCVTVNISGIQLKQTNFIETVVKALNDNHLDPQYLELELTESILVESLEKAIRILNELKSLGVRISIDDFGTGYSSLNYLKRLPIDILKIDRSFVKDIFIDPGNEAIIKAIFTLARSLNLEVIAEGVETAQQLAYLHELGCDKMQGFLFSPPLPTDSLMKLLKEGKSLKTFADVS